MKKIALIVASAALLASCGSKDVNTVVTTGATVDGVTTSTVVESPAVVETTSSVVEPAVVTEVTKVPATVVTTDTKEVVPSVEGTTTTTVAPTMMNDSMHMNDTTTVVTPAR